jgi:ParB family chromosome partitioning protein
MTDPLLHLPLDAIDDTAFPRDRTLLSSGALDELRRSIARTGLRQPIEVCALDSGFDGPTHSPTDGPTHGPTHGPTYGLISGFRRLSAVRALHEMTGDARWSVIPAFLRQPPDRTETLRAMVEENTVREDLSPWELGLVAAAACARGDFPTLDAAVAGLFPCADRTRRQRLRQLATVADELDGLLTDPETLLQSQLLGLAAAINAGLGDLARAALAEAGADAGPARQWQALRPVLAEAEGLPGRAAGAERPTIPGRPRRMLALPQGLLIRREKLPNGWALRFTGPQARDGSLVDDVFDYIERQFMPRT